MVLFALDPDVTEVARARARHLAFLAVLAEVQRTGLGWERRHVSGWLSVAEVEGIADRKLSGCGPALVARGHARALALAEYGFHRRLYRVTDRGSVLIDSLVGRDHSPVEAPSPDAGDGGRFPLNVGAWSALLGLHWAVAHVRLSRHREPGCFLLREVRAAYPAGNGRHAPFSTLEYQWLRARGMVEQRHALALVRPNNPASQWKLSAAGERVQVVADHHWPGVRGWHHHRLDAQVLPEPVQLDVAAEIARCEARAAVPHDLLAGKSRLAALVAGLPLPPDGHEQ